MKSLVLCACLLASASALAQSSPSGAGVFNSVTLATVADAGTIYVIPESGTVASHVNGVDLFNGTAKTGGAWTTNGSVPLVPSVPAAVGPFSDTNYFSQTSSPAAVGQNFTMAIVFRSQSNLASGNIPVIIGSSSYYIQPSPGSASLTLNGYNTATANGVVNNKLSILVVGADASGGGIHAMLNGGTYTTTAFLVGTPGTTAFIGRYQSGTGYSFPGQVMEIMVNNAANSSAAFSALTTAIANNLALQGTETVNGITVLQGGTQVGAQGTLLNFLGAAFCPLASGACSVQMPGANAKTHCVGSSDDLTTSVAAGCSAQADAGFVNIDCLSTVTGVGTAMCFQ